MTIQTFTREGVTLYQVDEGDGRRYQARRGQLGSWLVARQSCAYPSRRMTPHAYANVRELIAAIPAYRGLPLLLQMEGK